MSERTQRVSEVIRRELSTLMSREILLEGLLITISNVDVSPDLKNAYVYVSMIEQSVPQGRVIALLNRCRPRWQPEVGRRLETKFTPRLHFQFDKALERGDKVMELMLEIERKKAAERLLTGESEETPEASDAEHVEKSTGEYRDDSGRGPVEI